MTPDGHRVVVSGNSPGSLDLADLTSLEVSGAEDADRLRLDAELRSGRHLVNGGPVNLTSEQWLERWERRGAPLRCGYSSSTCLRLLWYSVARCCWICGGASS